MTTRTPKDLPRPLRWIPSEGIEAITERLREWTRDVERYLKRTPSYDLRTITFIGGQTNLDIAVPFTPSVVQLSQVLLTETPATAIASTLYLDWIQIERGYRIRSIQGLTSGTRYTVTLLAQGDFS